MVARLCLLFSCCISAFSFAQIIPPYSSNFDNLPADTLGWIHYAATGTDDWEVGAPAGDFFNVPYSSDNVWKTNLDTTCVANSTRYLETPYFDLTDASVEYVASFYYRLDVPSGGVFKVQYKKGSNGTWAWLPSTGSESNFPISNFPGSTGTNYVHAVRNLDNLTAPLDSIKFRFYVSTTTVSNINDEGWMIDNFDIHHAQRNLFTFDGDTITGVTDAFTEFELDYPYGYLNEFSLSSTSYQRKFYFSEDPIFEGSDTLLKTINSSVGSFGDAIYLLDDIIPLPPDLTEGYHYIFYVFDAGNTVVENDESDNMGMAVLAVEPVYSPNYIQTFDTTSLGWSSSVPSSTGTYWQVGGNYSWNIEEAHSGDMAWYATMGTGSGEDYLESAYFDLTTCDSATMCFFYKSTYNDDLYFWKPKLTVGPVSTPVFQHSSTYLTEMPPVRIPKHWDCYCIDISSHENEVSTKFRILRDEVSGGISNGIVMDDIYVGERSADLSIEGNKTDLFTSSQLSSDTIHYYLFNSGLKEAAGSTTNFYWSTDSLLDGSDILLGNNTEPGMNDTTYAGKYFVYPKQDLFVPVYYIIYELDSDSLINEMREYNNVGYFKVHQQAAAVLPYSNDFESQIDGWRHAASLGNDSWNWDVPSGPYHDNAFSGDMAWLTNDGSIVEHHCESHLFTPVFDLTTLNHPVMEFNLSVAEVYSSSHRASNISYSIDGGATWLILDQTSQTRKRLYSLPYFDIESGLEIELNPAGTGLIDLSSPIFAHDDSYSGRDARDDYRVVIDLAFIGDQNAVQFRFNFANDTSNFEGVMMDDFRIVEANIDLQLENRRHLLVGSADKTLDFYYNIINYGNEFVAGTQMAFYLSTDSILSVDDIALNGESVTTIGPYESELSTHHCNLTSLADYSLFNYLILEIDPVGVVLETDETNNVDFFYLDMDSLSIGALPYSYDFSDSIIHGWNWYNEGGLGEEGPRFRHLPVYKEPAEFVAGGGFWFTDKMGQLDGSPNWEDFGKFYLNSPTFDLTAVGTAMINFDLICIGSISGSSSNYSGGNMQSSIDGGTTWQTMYSESGSLNWYSSTGPSLASLYNDQGWHNKTNWTPAVYNISGLVGNQVRFRYQFSSDFAGSPDHIHGMRVDNFQLAVDAFDLEIANAPEVINTSIASFYVNGTYDLINNATTSVYNIPTYFYWSEDSLLDSGDPVQFMQDHAAVNYLSSQTLGFSVPRPAIIDQLEYYLFYVIDGDSTLNELDELNNGLRSKIVFNSTNAGLTENSGFVTVLDGPESITIVTGTQNNSELNIALYDAGGKLLLARTEQALPGMNIYLSKDFLAPGIYFLHIESATHQSTSKIIGY